MFPIIQHAPAAVKFDVTAGEQGVFDLLAGALNARFCPRKRNAQAFCQFHLAESFKLGQQERLAVGFGQGFDDFAQGEGEGGGGVGVFFGGQGQVIAQVGERTGAAVVVNDGVAGNLVYPGFQAVVVLQAGEAGVDFEKDVLQNVFGGGFVADAAQDEGAQALMQGVVEAVQVGEHGRVRVETIRQAGV